MFELSVVGVILNPTKIAYNTLGIRLFGLSTDTADLFDKFKHRIDRTTLR